MTNGNWRWNVDPFWENFSALFEEVYRAMRSHDDFNRYKHCRAVLLFAEISLEAFLNQRMRKHLSGSKTDEKEITKRLRHTKLKEKIEKWPAEFCGRDIKFEDADFSLFGLFRDYHDLRHAITHERHMDHSVYLSLDTLAPWDVLESVVHVVLQVCEANSEQYPYWLLGWNFVGFNHDPAWPFLTVAQHFVHSLGRMGYIKGFSTADYYKSMAWQAEWLTTREKYYQLRKALDGFPEDIEPGHAKATRLCRRWWDREYILSTGHP